jgi:hypothetical protein
MYGATVGVPLTPPSSKYDWAKLKDRNANVPQYTFDDPVPLLKKISMFLPQYRRCRSSYTTPMRRNALPGCRKLHAAQLYIRENYEDKTTQPQTQLCAKTGPDGG